MHFSTLLISNTGKGRREIKRLMRPFQEVWTKSDERCTEYNEEGEYWYNPNAKWDWYVIGGRYRGRIHAKHGRKTPIDPYHAPYDWYQKYNRRGCYDFAKVGHLPHG